MLSSSEETQPNSTMVVKSYEVILMNYEEYRAHKIIALYIPPIILIIGTIGNIVSFIILRKSMVRISTYFYLATLAIADVIVLQFGLLRTWTGELTGYDIRNANVWTCKLVVCLNYVFSDFSVWIIVAVTSERYIAVCNPLRATVLCSIQRARCVGVVTFVLMCAVNAHVLWTVDITHIHLNTSEVTRCEPHRKYEYFMTIIWPWIDCIVYSFLPCVILTVLNILIIRQIIAARKCRTTLQNCKSGRNNLLQKKLPTEGSIKLTFMLLVVSFTFMLTTLPNGVSIIVYLLWDFDVSNDVFQSVSNFALLRTLTELLMYTNHAVNFFLYCATGKKFRKGMEKIICQIKKLRRTASEHTPNSMLMTRMSLNSSRKSFNNYIFYHHPKGFRRSTDL